MVKKDVQTGSWRSAMTAVLVFVTFAFLWGTGEEAQGRSQSGKNVHGPLPAAHLSAQQVLANPALLHERLEAKNPGYQGQAQFAKDPVAGLVGDFTGSTVSDLSPLEGIPFGALDLRGQPISDLKPLKGMPLMLLGLEATRVTDLKPLKGMHLKKLYLNNTAVNDLSPLAGMPLTDLMLVGARVKDLKPLKGTPLKALWLSGTQASDITPLSKCPLESLTLEGTRVADLKPLSKMTSLKRLHIGNTPVSDLTPLKRLKLERLIFTPGNISTGLGDVRNMRSLLEVGSTLETRMPPEQFWSRYDQKKGE